MNRRDVAYWHFASVISAAEIRTLSEAKRTYGEACYLLGPTRMTRSGHSQDLPVVRQMFQICHPFLMFLWVVS
jgi:hypothetical protein